MQNTSRGELRSRLEPAASSDLCCWAHWTSLAGCRGQAKTYPVEGKVVYEDGAAVTGGIVEFITTPPGGKAVNAAGSDRRARRLRVQHFRRATAACVASIKQSSSDRRELLTGDVRKVSRPKGVDISLSNYETSGLVFSVKPEKNYFVIKVRREK